ncbi:MAG: immunity 26/phosphotriesterase HocA family protein [Planctomycetota bacterium]|nr:immunity 26/phosphotriesterase HocA family protein [Planctomycetota bacterium]
MKLPYTEGTVFLVPLRNGGYARGVVARASPEGKGLFGYFFGPRLPSPAAATLEGLDPERAVLRVVFGDLGLINGEWPILGTVLGWERSQWPMPDFVRRDPLGKRKPVLVRYSDTDPLRVEAEYPIEDDSDLTPDSAYGYGAVEIKLTKLLG